MLVIKINTDNDAFSSEESARQELARILRKIALDLENNIDAAKSQTIFDYNGNDIGRWRFQKES